MKDLNVAELNLGLKEEDEKLLSKGIDLLSNIIAWESGELNEEDERAFFQHLVDTGLAWQLQGTYGRRAAQLLGEGLISLPAGRIRHQ